MPPRGEARFLSDFPTRIFPVSFPKGHLEMSAYFGAPLIFAGTLHGGICLTKKGKGAAFTVWKSFRIMKEWRGIHFDPRVLDAFFQVQAEFCI